MKNFNKALTAMMMCGTALCVSACGRANISQNDSAIEIVNGVMTDDHITPGQHWYLAVFSTVQFPSVSHVMQTVAITAVDKGQQCDKDCVTLTTQDQQTVTGSLIIQYTIERQKDPNKESVMSELYRLRGYTTQADIEDKLLVPPFLNCMIGIINHTDARDLIEKDKETVAAMKTCTQPTVSQYHIKIEDVFNRGFGPSAEARQSMKRFSDARQDGQVAEIQIKTAPDRQKAALINADITAAVYKEMKDKGLPPDQIPALMCMADPASKDRPCIPYTATGGAMAPGTVSVTAGTPAPH